MRGAPETPLFPVPHRPFAKTGKTVSILGLGTVKFGRNQSVKYPGGAGFTLPSDAEIEEILDLCRAHNLNFLDTAPAYGTSEERLGKLLGNRRDDFFLMTKTGEEFENGQSEYIFTRDHTQKSIERSLKRLKTDRLDCVLVHSSRDDVAVMRDTPVLEVLEQYKQKGDILSYGVSTYTIEGGKMAADLTDAVMVAYNPAYRDELPVIEYAAKKGKAVLIKKGLASGHLDQVGSPADALRHITNIPGVTSLIFGSLNPVNILNNIKALETA
ncbi:MAG: aldo/keto reductase [Rhodospirillales bacterium]|nr:aldo/keto reductase [Rhodospirillales bacterium]